MEKRHLDGNAVELLLVKQVVNEPGHPRGRYIVVCHRTLIVP